MNQITFNPSETGEVPAAKRTNRGVRRFWVLAGWALILGVLAMIVLRWQNPDRSLVVALVGLTPFFAVPLVFGVLSAWLSRSNPLRAMAAVVTAAFIFTTSPVDAVIGCHGGTASDAITIYTANVLVGGGRPAEVASSVAAADADVILMQEVSWQFMTDLRAEPMMAGYSYWSFDTERIPHKELIVSRWPLENVELDRSRGGDLTTADVLSPNGRFQTGVVHVHAPINDTNAFYWNRQLRMLADREVSGPAIIGGDFNATSDHQPFRHLLGAGWTDVHDQKGCGPDHTWPVDGLLPVPVYRLDHILVSDDFEVLDVQFGDPGGSDHKPVISSIRLSS